MANEITKQKGANWYVIFCITVVGYVIGAVMIIVGVRGILWYFSDADTHPMELYGGSIKTFIGASFLVASYFLNEFKKIGRVMSLTLWGLLLWHFSARVISIYSKPYSIKTLLFFVFVIFSLAIFVFLLRNNVKAKFNK